MRLEIGVAVQGLRLLREVVRVDSPFRLGPDPHVARIANYRATLAKW